MLGTFTFDGVESSVYNVYIFDNQIDDGAVPLYSRNSVPGRNGDIIFPENMRANVIHRYDCVITGSGAMNNYNNLKNRFLSRQGYYRLEDSFHPTEFYQAFIDENFVPVFSQDRDMLRFQITFNRKPQRFLKIGEEITTFTASGVISNPTRFQSRPLMRVYGTGQLSIRPAQVITISEADEYTDIDCDLMECFKGVVSKNEFVTFSTLDYPYIAYGDNTVTLGAGITKVEITPRWWRV